MIGLVVRGVGFRPLLTGGLRGPTGLLVTAAICLSLPLIMDCSKTPISAAISAASSVLCKNTRMIGRSVFPSKPEEGSHRPAAQSNAIQVNTLCDKLAEAPSQRRKANHSLARCMVRCSAVKGW